jgi:alpha-L-fucosidase 2
MLQLTSPPMPGLDAAAILGRHLGVMTRPPASTPCNHFPDGPLMGNGDMTVVAGGRADLQQFHIGKSDFWTDGEGWGFTNEEYDQYVVSPITVGGVRLWVRDFACATYRQEIDLLHAEVRGRFEAQGWTLHTRAWTAATANLLILELQVRGDVDLHPLGLHVRTWAKCNDDPGRASLPTDAGCDDELTWATRQTWDRGRWVSRAALATRVLGTATTRSSDRRASSTAALVLRPNESAMIITALAGGRDAITPFNDAAAMLQGVSVDTVERLRQQHRAWWLAYWDKCLIDLGGDIVERYWYGSQYAMACCSRAGHVCPGIFGFSTDDHPRWSGDYHLNYNAQQPFAGVFSSNRGELAEPFIDAMNDFMPEGQRRAAVELDPPQNGLYYPIGLGPWGVVAQDDAMGQKCAAAYAAVTFVDHFHHQCDPAYTRDRLYPFVRETARFWEGFLRDDGQHYAIHGSAAHEHGGHDVNAALDLTLVRRLFLGLIAMSESLQLDACERSRWHDIVTRLSPYPTAIHNDRRVFKQSENAPGFTRSITLLNLAWPGDGRIGPAGDAELTTVMRDTLNALDRWDQGNSFAWTLIAAVRTAHREAYARFAARLEAPDGLRDNLTVAQAYGGIETCGATLAVNEMLLQSEGGALRLFPVWPADRNASFQRLRARGGLLISASWKHGTVTHVQIESELGQPVALVNPWGCDARVQATITDSAELAACEHDGKLLRMVTRPGGRYHLQPAGQHDPGCSRE